MIAVNDLRQGVIFENEGNMFQVLEFSRHKMARQKGMVHVKARNIENGATKEFTFKSADSVEDAEVERAKMEFVYFDERKNEFIFANPENKNRVSMDGSSIDSSQHGYLVSGIMIDVLQSPNGTKVYSMELPNTVDLTVTQAPPAEKGNTASGGTKRVTVETGIFVNTPFFIKNGDVIKVNTTTGEYIERVNG